MLVRKSYLLVIIPLIALSAAQLQNDLSRVKRSPYYCPPSQPAPPPPPPPPPAPLPRSFLYPIPANSGLRLEQFIERQQRHNERNTEDQGQYDAQPYSAGTDQIQFGNYNDGSRPPCEKCGRKNLAVSNAKSDTGDAIAIAVSKGNSG